MTVGPVLASAIRPLWPRPEITKWTSLREGQVKGDARSPTVGSVRSPPLLPCCPLRFSLLASLPGPSFLVPPSKLFKSLEPELKGRLNPRFGWLGCRCGWGNALFGPKGDPIHSLNPYRFCFFRRLPISTGCQRCPLRFPFDQRPRRHTRPRTTRLSTTVIYRHSHGCRLDRVTQHKTSTT